MQCLCVADVTFLARCSSVPRTRISDSSLNIRVMLTRYRLKVRRRKRKCSTQYFLDNTRLGLCFAEQET